MWNGLNGTRVLSQLAALMLAGTCLAACSSVPDWIDPTTWLGPDAPPPQTADAQYPDLTNMPAKPAVPDDAAQNQQVADSLGAARDHVEYSADQLRGGTDAPAPPPSDAAQPAAKAPITNDLTAEPAEPEQPADASQAAAAAEPAESADTASQLASGTEASGSGQSTAPAQASAPAAPAQQSSAVAALPEPVAQSASTEPSAAPTPATVPPLPPVPVGAAPQFAASSAPPLDPGVANYVPPSIISRYAQGAPVAAGESPVRLRTPQGVRRLPLQTGTTDVGGPEAMSGAVVADLGMLSGSAQAQAFAAQGMASVRFAGNGSALTREGLETVDAMAQAFAARGGQGYVRVTGYGGGRARSVSAIEAEFDRAEQRARHVAAALIKAGVPADRILTDAQSQAPAGDAARADIALQ